MGKRRCLTYVDLFAGCGGLSLGFDMAGFRNVFSVEYDEVFSESYKNNFPNHKMLTIDIKDLSEQEIKQYIKNEKIDVVIGGPPCQGFSIAGKIGRNFIIDPRNFLFKEFLRIVEIIKPRMFMIENVATLERHNGGKTIVEIISNFEKLGYSVKYKVLNAVNFNVPQNRRRVFIVGQKEVNNTFQFPIGNRREVSIKSAINDLPKLASGEASTIPNHAAMNHSTQMLKKMSYVKDGGDRNDIPEKIRPQSGDIRKYIRYNSGAVSPCVTGDMRKIFHYNQNRALTARELARLQTFPDDFIFCGNSSKVQQQIGNAVPVSLAFSVAKAVKKALL
jgi:DNA (cytosine-5)-methyltransferase 1